MKSKHPVEVQQAVDQLNNATQSRIANGETAQSGYHYIIPIVFHIIHDYGAENISDAQVLDEVAILNRDYAKLNADTANITPSFVSLASQCDIEFRLATIDPDGNCTNGIDRIASKRTNNADDYSKLNYWPRRNYLNVWVVKTIGASGVAGYAYFPGIVGPFEQADGVLILSDYIGSIGTGSVSTSRALTHEIGHFLNLEHPWGPNNSPGVACGDDGIPDTPKTKGWDHCPTATQSIVCDTSNGGVVENYQNYMDYSYCSVMFTHDQVIAMHATLNSTVSERNHLWQQSNLIGTGTNVLVASNCKPHADFHPNHPMVCEGGTIQFTDNSWGGTVTNRTWTFYGGTPSTSTTANPTITYNAAGLYSVKLTVSNVNGIDSIAKWGSIIVGVPYGEIIAPMTESFENPLVLDNGWHVQDYAADNKTWRPYGATGYTGTRSVVMNNFNSNPNEVDELITPMYDLRYMTGMTMNFRYSFASCTSDTGLITEKLRVFASTNCGQTWSPLHTYNMKAYCSSGMIPNEYAPANGDPQTWGFASINLNSTYAVSRVRFKFEWTSGRYGNDFFMDDLNINGVVGINDPSVSTSFNVFPNPAGENGTVQLYLKQKENVQITMTDLNGRIVKNISQGEMNEGENNISFSTEGIASGLYLIVVNDGTSRQVHKLAINH
jgi:PKD repeat protein